MCGVEVMVTSSTAAGETTVPSHVYSPACEVCSEKNERVTVTVVLLLKVSFMTMSSPEVTGPEGPIQ